MNLMDNQNLKNIKGGAMNLTLAATWGAALSFLVGLIDGFINPKKCNN